eukprot:g3190.t1
MQCSIARTLEHVGSWWSLLIIRDAMMGARRFKHFQASLGIAKNTLTSRLNELVAGIEVRPLVDMTMNANFNEVFFTDVRVPRGQIVGAPGQGWQVANATLTHERGMLGDPNAAKTRLLAIAELMQKETINGERLIDNPVFRDRLVALQARVYAMQANGLRVMSSRIKGESAGMAGLIIKLQGCELNHELARLAIDAMGEFGLLYGDTPYLRDFGAWQAKYMYDLGLIIGGGTAQIQKNIISERGLGMPRYLDAASALDQVRLVADGDTLLGEAITGGLSELGVGQILIPEQFDGLGLGVLDAALIQEELGAAVAPAAYMASALAVIGISAAGTEAQKSEWLPKLASGEVRFGVAINERVGAREGAGVRTDGGQLSGKSLFAMETQNATHVIVVDTDGRLQIAALNDVTRTAHATIDRTRDLAELEFNATPAVSLDGENEIGLAADKMVQVGRLLLAADTLGAAQTMLDKAVAYAIERKQFNRVIGSFQSVKHLCAEMAAHLEPARALVWHAAHAYDENFDDAAMMACLAKSHLAEIGTFIARTATEVHGGMGFTDLVGLHYWFKRIGANRQLLGGPEKVREDAAKLQGWA